MVLTFSLVLTCVAFVIRIIFIDNPIGIVYFQVWGLINDIKDNDFIKGLLYLVFIGFHFLLYKLLGTILLFIDMPGIKNFYKEVWDTIDEIFPIDTHKNRNE